MNPEQMRQVAMKVCPELTKHVWAQYEFSFFGAYLWKFIKLSWSQRYYMYYIY